MPPEHMVYVWWKWSSDEGEFESLDIDFTIHNDIVGFSGPHGLYLMLGSAQISGAPFYFGLQTDVYDPCVGVSRQELDIFEMGNSLSGPRQSRRPGRRMDAVVRSRGRFHRRQALVPMGRGRISSAHRPGRLRRERPVVRYVDHGQVHGETVWGGSLRFPYENGKAAIRSPLYTTMEIYGGTPIRPIDIPEWHVSIARPSGDSVKSTRGVTGFQAFSSHILNSDARYDPTRKCSTSASAASPSAQPSRRKSFSTKTAPTGRLATASAPVHLLQRPVSPAVLVLGATGQA